MKAKMKTRKILTITANINDKADGSDRPLFALDTVSAKPASLLLLLLASIDGTSKTVRVSGETPLPEAEAPTEPTGENVPYLSVSCLLHRG